MKKKEVLDTSGLDQREKEIIEEFLRNTETKLSAKFTRERAEEILKTFIGDFNQIRGDFGGSATDLAEIFLEKDEAPLQNNTSEERALEREIDDLFEQLAHILKNISKD